MNPWGREMAGRLDEVEVASEALRGNPLGDPHVRPLWVYLPPGYDDDRERRYPSVYVIQGFTGQLDMWRNREALRPTYIEALDELFASGSAPPCIVVLVDAWTSLGGSQYLDSPARAGTTHTCATRSSRSSTRGTGRSLAGVPGASRASPPAGTAP